MTDVNVEQVEAYEAKNRAAPISGVPWYQALGAHAIIHGATVALITGRTSLGIAEAAIHAITDDAKCKGRLTFNQDQAIHLSHVRCFGPPSRAPRIGRWGDALPKMQFQRTLGRSGRLGV